MSTAPPQRSFSLIKAGLLTLLCLLLALGIIIGFGMKTTLDRYLALGESLFSWSSKLSQQQITQNFRESLRLLSPTQGDVLEVATLEMEETATSMDHRSLFDIIPLGTTVSEIKVPVVYRYHLKLSDHWQLYLKAGHCVVVAPVIRPSTPPAIRTDEMEKKTAAGWARFNAQENLDALERCLTPMTEKRAGSSGKMQKVREGSRQAVAKFVQTWLLKEQHWGEGKIHHIRVIFADEPEAKDAASVSTPHVHQVQL
jgi:hypothetical protein